MRGFGRFVGASVIEATALTKTATTVTSVAPDLRTGWLGAGRVEAAEFGFPFAEADGVCGVVSDTGKGLNQKGSGVDERVE